MRNKIDTNAIKSAVDIVDVISRYIDLKKNGSEYQACCPFHDEKTPSFTVVPNKGFYHCFGCGEHGDVIDFVTKYTGCDFKEAAETLGHKKLNGAEPVKLKSKRVDPYEHYAPILHQLKLKPGKTISVINPKRDGKMWSITPHAVYDYGKQGCVLRTEINGKKITPMVRFCTCPEGGKSLVLYPFDDPRPIYGYQDGNQQVLVVEGEKAKDHLQAVCGDRLTVVSWAGGSNGVDKTDWSPLAGRNVILWPDNDEPGFKTMHWLHGHLQDIAESVRCVIPDADLPKGWDGADHEWDDAAELFHWCKTHIGELPEPEEPKQDSSEPGLPAANTAPPSNSDDDWKRQLMFKDDGEALLPTVNNAQVLLSYHPDLAGCLGYNLFTKAIDVCLRPPWETEPSDYPRELSDVDDTRATAWLERHGVKLTINTVHNAIVSAAHHRPFNPLQDYLSNLEWDGTERLTTAMNRYFGCEDNEYSRSVSRRFLIGAIARAMNPGCKMDTMLILEGPQGLKKSTAVAELFGEDWFTDELGDLGSKDAAMQVQGVWCVEIAELATMNRAEANRIKEWITRREDRFRPPYGRNIIKAPRSCVLIGTVNPEGGYLKDATGGRRFWPIKCTSIDIKTICEEREQLWAEAIHAWRKGERWWFDNDERHIAETEQEARYESDSWEDAVQRHVKGKDKIAVADVMEEALDLKPRDQNQLTMNRVAKILVSNGYERRQRRIDGRRQWVYVKEGE